MQPIDFRSDTLTRPDKAMRQRMAEAEVGDDFYGEDPTIRALEEHAASLFGKERALFVLSGTMGNLLSIRSQVAPGSAAILSATSHLHLNETGHLASIGGITSHALPTPDGRFDAAALEKLAPLPAVGAAPSVLAPKLRAICVENTHNGEGGRCLDIVYLEELRGFATRRGLVFHMDGARIFNAAVALGVSPSALAAEVDSVSFCLSKGLGAPGGAIIAAKSDVIEEARHWRQMVGGGMRQAGILAAAGLMALEENIDRLAEDHENAKTLARGLRESGLHVALDEVETNIVMAYIPPAANPGALHKALIARGVLTLPPKGNRLRFVTHKDICAMDILAATDRIARAMAEMNKEDQHA